MELVHIEKNPPSCEQDSLIEEQHGCADDGLQAADINDDAASSRLNFQHIALIQTTISDWFKTHRNTLNIAACVVSVVLYGAYLIYACYLDIHRAFTLVIITCLVILWLGIRSTMFVFGSRYFQALITSCRGIAEANWRVIKWVLIILTGLAVIVVVLVTIGNNYKQYTGLAGLAFFLITLFLTSHNPAKVKWRPVLWGMLLNLVFALFILKTKVGLALFEWLAKQVTVFLKYSDAGAMFVFGKDTFAHHFFVFKILPTIVFFSCVISLLYYLGVMQAVIQKIAFVMQVTMGTTATESLSCAGNIFVGQTEAPILIRPFLAEMTNSELHAVMTGGFATIAGGVLAAFIGLGIDPTHLIAASVMNAPMALAASKLSYPQIEKPEYIHGHKITFTKPTEQNFIEAAAAGASQSIGLVANIAANLIAFMALLAFVNAGLEWFGSMVDFPQLSFELICSYLFWPVAFLMGVEWRDCGLVAELIGTKLFINEFVAYETLSKIIKNRETCTLPLISKKSEVIATYALCGFANLSSIGIQLGGIGAMVPSRKPDLAKLVIRALLVGSVATLMTASLAGMLVTDYTELPDGNSTAINGTLLAVNGSSRAGACNSTVY